MILNTYHGLTLSTAISSLATASPIFQIPTLTPNLSTTHPTTPTPILNDNLSCIDLLNPFSRRPKYDDCTIAIRQLPRFPDVGAFHNRGGDDPFKLPVEKSYDSCTVKVELYAAGTTTVVASWPGIATRANTVNRMCLHAAFPIYKGGWATYAKDDRIVVSLAYPDEGGGGGDGMGSAR
ncbi:MAG: hypothetical protein ALECFALPRED_006717 [Alectoria fallacina]|uniref:Uncharacterized protein n=1 Tax=Alectoria fallacina TaxID=1903189 RepID=A0A8H3G403_9LECA|nr:MAG: hypothetical protein ALECFALPRED_006717 [Alectoria fallacina]